MRKVIGKIHLWLSMVVGIFIVLIGLTGSLLVFEPELNHLLHPNLYKVTEGEKVTYQQVLNTVSSSFPKGEINRIYTPDGPDARGVYVFQLKEGPKRETVYVDSGTGKINGTLGDKAFLNTIHTFHQSLLLENFKGEEIVGIIGFLFFFITLSGIYLWWPGIKKWKNGFKMRHSKNPYVKQYDLHKVIGGAAIPFLLIVSLTGALFAFDETIFGWFGGHAKVELPKEDLISKPLPTGKLPLDQLLRIAEKEVPEGVITQVRVPEKKGHGMSEEALEIRLSRSYDPGYGNIRVWVDSFSGKIAGKLDPKINSGLLYQIWHLPLHTGSFGGIVTKILYAAGGLTPLILMFTGTYMWIYKKKKRKQKKSSVLAA
ncbi:PepSY-associated TM helix domain-containing protein [Neobacillus niacini]|uniref:PepSY-associated TM helix domain-containing protein n=1 Tax=Neobacillus niacini TaxID=86668 RepID=UPI00285A15DB|nr:PepSY-associated TM helix domain-containing protein [Neobacillus niacini]MDR6998938.1 putative iron-regulated membrane protein [Neobacillus niacini]